jgi:hypothetical protein
LASAESFIERIRPMRSYDRWNSAHKEIGRAAKAAFGLKPKMIRGAVAKQRIVVKLIGADDLDTWRGDKDCRDIGRFRAAGGRRAGRLRSKARAIKSTLREALAPLRRGFSIAVRFDRVAAQISPSIIAVDM